MLLTERHSGKTKQVTNLSVLKGKLKFFRFEIVKYETRAFKRKIEIKPIRIMFIFNISRLPRTITYDFRVGFFAQFHRPCYKTIGSCFSVHYRVMEPREVWRARKKRKSCRGDSRGQL